MDMLIFFTSIITPSGPGAPTAPTRPIIPLGPLEPIENFYFIYQFTKTKID